ncbi:hypothetical protein TRIUR3_04751 [Triticum urartu]|uniref:Uncharacterized protein n=1 Tax=Triticum urartu TaxID=4572 RepID=M7ZBZ5_TRIUA|nr:hypothetical protein TRIUR3_04751 [Triticum urartu]
MGHIADPAGAVVVGCKVLPIFNENGIVDGAVKKIVHRIDGKKAVARVKELLKWAAHARPYGSSNGVSGKKWKQFLSFQGRDGGGAAAPLWCWSWRTPSTPYFTIILCMITQAGITSHKPVGRMEQQTSSWGNGNYNYNYKGYASRLSSLWCWSCK